jgi:5'-deoxynucleotidase
VYEEIEQNASQQLLSYLPEDMREDYRPLFGFADEDSECHKIVKGADKLSALIKCIEERQMGNGDFLSAEKATLEAVHNLNLPEAEVFLEEFIPAYTMTLDDQAR